MKLPNLEKADAFICQFPVPLLLVPHFLLTKGVMTDEEFAQRSAQFERLAATYIAPYTVMLAIVDRANPTPQGIIANGTGSLVNTGAAQLLVTNNHVYEGFERRRAVSDEMPLMMSGMSGRSLADISDVRLISRDKDRDLAVLDVPVATVSRQGKLFSPWDSWPPARPAVGMPAFLFGYPGQGRVPMGDSLGIRPLTLGRYVSTVTERQFSLADDRGDSEMRTPDGATPITDYGGISGQRHLRDDTRPEAHTGRFRQGGSFGWDIIYATFASHINADGTIRDADY